MPICGKIERNIFRKHNPLSGFFYMDEVVILSQSRIICKAFISSLCRIKLFIMLNSHIEEINECISHLMTALFIVIQNFVIVTQLNVTTYYIIKCNPIIRPHCIRHFIMRTVS